MSATAVPPTPGDPPAATDAAPTAGLTPPVLVQTTAQVDPIITSRPPRPRPKASTALLVLAVLAVCYTLWAAQELILPVLLAMFFALVGNPVIRLLQRAYVPRFVGALIVVLGGIAGLVVLGTQLVDPAKEWVSEVPREMRALAPKLRSLIKPMQEANKAAENIARAAGGESSTAPMQVVKTETSDPWKSLAATPKAITGVLAVVLLTFFFMVYGQTLQRHAVALLPSRQQKRLTVEILQSIERELSRYVATISIINAVVGLAFALLLHFVLAMPLNDALLWGTMAFALNYAPYVGPLIGILVMLLVGFISFDETWRSLAPAALYLGLHTLEGQIITPIVLGKRMALSPLVLILSLMVFGWLWGIIGLLLAVPLLVCVKIVLERVDLEGWAKLLE